MDDKIVIRGECLQCDSVATIEVSKDGYDNWKNGELIQDAMPELTANERELLISSLCEVCLFGLTDLENASQVTNSKELDDTIYHFTKWGF